MRKTEKIQSCIGRVKLYWPNNHENRQLDREGRSWEHPPREQNAIWWPQPLLHTRESQPRHKAIGNNASCIVLLREQSSFLNSMRKYKLIPLHSICAPGYVGICNCDPVRGDTSAWGHIKNSLPAEDADVEGGYSETNNSLIPVFKMLEKREKL